MSKTAIVTARVSDELLARLDRLAQRLDRSRAWVISQALTRYAEEELAFLDFVQVGEDAIDRGEFVTHEQLLDDIKAWKADRQKRAA